ncbi:hypothetical protein PIB30_011635 [Stylosanthes scabra]|uniref:Uncharacterized protein n=1 Tax=Stylosanthes scabra TaxID=79078 RepID=A0ABU6W5D5_9FABA|nr:hypothetical protein [Stylosanthes scabra]
MLTACLPPPSWIARTPSLVACSSPPVKDAFQTHRQLLIKDWRNHVLFLVIKHERLVNDKFFFISKGQERFRVTKVVRVFLHPRHEPFEHDLLPISKLIFSDPLQTLIISLKQKINELSPAAKSIRWRSPSLSRSRSTTPRSSLTCLPLSSHCRSPNHPPSKSPPSVFIISLWVEGMKGNQLMEGTKGLYEGKG